MKFVMIDDSLYRCRRVEEELEKLGVECVTFHSLLPAIKFLKNNEIDGIITDMKYPIKEKGKEKMSGNLLLKWLILQKKQIPVLGNSYCSFSVQYEQYKGKMPGYCHMWILKEFIASIEKDHS
ncbi:MAG: hypothetical protein HFJ35_00530 [Clostridia bacterium]|nr:hypothetical protein [Clostridia bacterium]